MNGFRRVIMMAHKYQFSLKVERVNRFISIVFIICIQMSCLIDVQAHADTVVGDPSSRLNVGLIEYEGIGYRPKRRLTSVLLIGTDNTSETEVDNSFRKGGQADFLLLVVIDENNDTVTPIQINRDTITEISALTEFGQDMGSWNAQICLSHSFGNSEEMSCELTVDAVSHYLKDIPIDWYISMNLGGIAVLNNVFGGIEVTLDDDFSAYDSTMTSGATIKLRGKQAEYYTRMRYHVGDQTNASRLARQRNYIKRVMDVFVEKITENHAFVETVYRELETYLVTNMTYGRIVNLSNEAMYYRINDIVEIDGEYSIGEAGYIEFYPDDKSVWEAVLNIFYNEVD